MLYPFRCQAKHYILPLFFLGWIYSCKPSFLRYEPKPLSKESQAYWFDNQAEISSYQLSQARYGELREGKAVLLFVTEPFSPKHFAKADNHAKGNVQVLKMNFTKNFVTGIYPYSMMTSTFYPMDGSASSLKISSSSQEWCGHTYMEMKNQGIFHFDIRSYFQGENQKKTVKNAFLEDDVWSVIKLHPSGLPVGKFSMVPSFFYLRLLHRETKAYTCYGKWIKGQEFHQYQLFYPELQRTLTIDFSPDFPYQIQGWTEVCPDGLGKANKMTETKATLLRTMKTAYWQQNSNAFLPLRDSLGLH
jgi:hypothetical protein